MKPKSLIPLVVVLAVLVGLVVWKKTNVPETTIVEQAGLVTLLPDGLAKNDIAKLDLYSGAAPDKKLTLACDADAETWRVATHFNSLVKKDTIDKYLDSIVKIKGEPRATAAADADLELYNLTDAKAFHVEGYKKDAAEPYFHLLVGKSPGYNSVFIRKAGSNEVFVEETNLRQQAGIHGDDGQPPRAMPSPDGEAKAALPEPSIWLDKTALKMDFEKITKVAMTWPDKSAVFERHEKPKPAPPAPEEGAEPAPAPEPPVTPEYEWTLASGGPGIPMKTNGPQSMIQKLSFLEGTDVVDPTKKAEWGLEPPAYTAVISREGEADIRIEAGRPDPNGDGYVTVAGSPTGTVFKVSKFIFEQAFPKGTDVFELPALALDKATIEKVEIAQPEGAVTLVKDGESLKVVQPAVALEPQRSTADTLSQTLANWTPADYADSVPDLGEPTKVITFTGGGQSHTIKLYGPSKHVGGNYARLDDNPTLLVMSTMDAGKVFVAPRDLYVRTLLDIDDINISEIKVNAAADSYSLIHGDDDTWALSAGGATTPADEQAAEALAGEVSVLQAEDILFGGSTIEGAVETVAVKMKDGIEHVITVGPEKDGKHEVKISGKDQVFVVTSESKRGLFPPLASMKKPEPPAPAPEAAAPEASAVIEIPASAPAAPETPAAVEVAVPPVTVPAVEAVTIPPAEATVVESAPAPAPAQAEPAPAPAG